MGAAEQLDFGQIASLMKRMEKRLNQPAIEVGEWVLPVIINSMFGFSEDQLNNYRNKGMWLEGVHFKQNPARRYVYNPVAINKWQAENPEG